MPQVQGLGDARHNRLGGADGSSLNAQQVHRSWQLCVPCRPPTRCPLAARLACHRHLFACDASSPLVAAGLTSQLIALRDVWNAYGRCTAAGDAITYLTLGLDLDLAYPLVRALHSLCVWLDLAATLRLRRLLGGQLHEPPRRQTRCCKSSAACSGRCQAVAGSGCSSPILSSCWPVDVQPVDLPARVNGSALASAIKAAFGTTPQLTCKGCAHGWLRFGAAAASQHCMQQDAQLACC